MEVVEFEPEQVMRVETHDGPMTIHGFARFEALGDHQTRLTMGGDFPDLDDAMAEQIGPMIERSAATIRWMIEAER